MPSFTPRPLTPSTCPETEALYRKRIRLFAKLTNPLHASPLLLLLHTREGKIIRSVPSWHIKPSRKLTCPSANAFDGSLITGAQTKFRDILRIPSPVGFHVVLIVDPNVRFGLPGTCPPFKTPLSRKFLLSYYHHYHYHRHPPSLLLLLPLHTLPSVWPQSHFPLL